MANGIDEDVEAAKSVLRGKSCAPAEALALAKRLKSKDQFGWARKVLAKVRSSRIPDRTLELKLGQLHALCTYKDPDLPELRKLKDALRILEETDSLGQTTDPETLGLAGAIHKRFWQATGQRKHLEVSLAYYYRGYHCGIQNDFGYTAINAAFLLDLLAHLEEESYSTAGVPTLARSLDKREEAAKIRSEIVRSLPRTAELDGNEWLKKAWWFYATMAEAYFGLGPEHHADSTKWLRDGLSLRDIPTWERAS
ncbi:MAG: hypothetical protein P8020_21645, partial [Acidobacteriota bacterium]